MNIEEIRGDWRMGGLTSLANHVPANYPRGPSFNPGDIVGLSSMTEMPDGQWLSFFTPDTTVMALSVAFRSVIREKVLMPKILYSCTPSPEGPAMSVATTDLEFLYDYFEHRTMSVIFSFQAIESFCNLNIGKNVTDKFRIKRNKKKYDLMSADDLERNLSTSQKLSDVLPKILDVPTPKGKSVWGDYKKLKRARDAAVHIKSHDQQMAGRKATENSSDFLYFNFLKYSIAEYPQAAVDMIRYFVKEDDQPRWLNKLAYHD